MKSCQKPVDAWICGMRYAKDGVLSQNLVFSSKQALEYYSFMPSLMERNYAPQPCGKCAICQIRKRKDMTVRLAHERSMTDACCFITLTYDDDHIPRTNAAEWKSDESVPCLWRGDSFGYETLLPIDVQLFMKRLRRHLEYQPKKVSNVIRDHVEKPIRYFAVGEYGSRTHRPHYHILIFGWRPSDMVIHQLKCDYKICRSAQIEKLWTYGFSTVCDVNYGVAKYCARYVTKKFARMQKRPDEKYVCPEFTLQSVRNGGMGAPWLNRYYQNLFNGFVTVRSGEERISKCSVPKYYYDRLRKINRDVWLDLRDQKIEFLRSNPVRVPDPDEMSRIVQCECVKERVAAMRETI